MSPERLRRIAWAALLAAAVALLTVAAVDGGGAETDAERIQRLSASYACPICAGESVAESNAAVAATIREFIAAEVAAGSTDQEIRDALIRSYGAEVLLNPPAEGLGQLLWVLPVVVMVAGAATVTAVVDRGRAGAVALSDDDRRLVAAARAARTSRSAKGAGEAVR